MNPRRSGTLGEKLVVLGDGREGGQEHLSFYRQAFCSTCSLNIHHCIRQGENSYGECGRPSSERRMK